MLMALKREIDSNLIIIIDLNSLLSAIDRSCTQKINKDKMDSDYTLEQSDLRHI